MWGTTRLERRVDLAIRDLKSKSPDLYYTQEQLFYLIEDKVSRATSSGCLMLFALVAGIVCLTIAPIGAVPSKIVSVVCLGLFIFSMVNYIILEKGNFNQLINYWHPDNTPLDHLITQPTLDSNFQGYDLNNYSVGCVIVTEQNIHTDIIVKNGWHKEYNALVISQELYPAQVMPILQQELSIAPQMPIYFLHNVGANGEQMIKKFKNKIPFNVSSHPMKDIGFDKAGLSLIADSKEFKQKLTQAYLGVEDIPINLIQRKVREVTWLSEDLKLNQNVTQSNLHQSNTQGQPNTSSDPAKEYQKLKNTEEALWKVHNTLSKLNEGYKEVGQLVKQKETEYQQQRSAQGIDQVIEKYNMLKKDYALHRKLVTSLSAQFQVVDTKLLQDKIAEVNYLKDQIAQLQDQYFAQLDSINNSNTVEVLEKMKIAANTAVSWNTYQKQIKQLIEVQDKLATLEMQFLPYKEKLDEQAAELWQVFDKALAPLSDDKAVKAKTRDLIIDYGQQIKMLVKDKETCDQMEAHYQTNINELTTLTQQIEAWQNNPATDQMMDMKNKELWLNYNNYDEEYFWQTYRELLYNVKNPMIGIASPVQPPQQKQQWEQLYDILGL
jgi:hypothetical protein